MKKKEAFDTATKQEQASIKKQIKEKTVAVGAGINAVGKAARSAGKSVKKFNEAVKETEKSLPSRNSRSGYGNYISEIKSLNRRQIVKAGRKFQRAYEKTLIGLALVFVVALFGCQAGEPRVDYFPDHSKIPADTVRDTALFVRPANYVGK